LDTLAQTALIQINQSSGEFGDVHRDPSRLILIGKLLAVVVADAKAGVLLLDSPRRREAARRRFSGNLRPEQVEFRPLRTGL